MECNCLYKDFSIQAARKHDIPYPTFVLYANRVHNMLGPSPLNGYGLGGKIIFRSDLIVVARIEFPNHR